MGHASFQYFSTFYLHLPTKRVYIIPKNQVAETFIDINEPVNFIIYSPIGRVYCVVYSNLIIPTFT